MGRGRQKAKQQKIARKLKYLTTDTDYDELAKELSGQEPGTGSVDPFADLEDQYESHYADKSVDSDADASKAAGAQGADSSQDDDLDEYAKWAAEAAAKATSGEFPKASVKPAVPHKPIPMPKPRPIPSVLKPKHD